MSGTLLRTLGGALLALALMATGPVAGAAAAPSMPVPAPPAAVDAASGLAAARWAVQPCGGPVTFTWEHLGGRVNAEARWTSPAGGDPSTFGNCTVAFSYDVHWDWPKFCTVAEHELGHLAGHDHVDDPADVMSPYYVRPTSECARTAMPGTPATPRAKAAGPVGRHVTPRAQARRARDRSARAVSAR